MTTTTFFIIFIPILSILLLSVNLLLAPHNPYQEKDSVFECGFHSFLGQNRTQFNISFFIFGLLFLLFDLEILLVYPYSVSSYTNDIYGLIIMMLFFILLTLGFIFELGKNALTIDSKQTSISNNKNISTYKFTALLNRPSVLKSGLFSDYFRILTDRCSPGLEWALHNPPKPHAFTGLPLQSSGPGSGSGSPVPTDCPDVRHLSGNEAERVVTEWVRAVLAEGNFTPNNVIPFTYSRMVNASVKQCLEAQGFAFYPNYVLPLVTTPYFGVLSTLKHILSPFLSVFWCILPVLLLCFIDLFNTDFTINVYILDFDVTLTNYHLNFALLIWGSFNLMRKSIMLINYNRDAYNKGDYKSLILTCISLLVVLCLLCGIYIFS